MTMKLTARIKQNTSPMAKLVRRLASGRSMLIIDPMGDAAPLKRLIAAASKSGRSDDLFIIKPSRTTTDNPNTGSVEC